MRGRGELSAEKPISTVPEAVFALVERFDRQQQAYRSGQYNETQVRCEFLDPFWKALGWDVNNHQRYTKLTKTSLQRRHRGGEQDLLDCIVPRS